MTLRSYLRVLRERWRLIAVFFVVAVGLAVLATVLTPKSYTATSQVLVSATGSANPSVQAQSNAYVQTQVATYAKTITAPKVLAYIQDDLHPGLSDRVLKTKITASAKVGESIVSIDVTDGSPRQAADLANSAARGFVKAVETYSASVKLFVTGPADEPTAPTSPQPVINVALGALLGLLLGAAFAVVRDLLDNRIKTTEALAKLTGTPAMGVVVDDPKTERHPVAGRLGMNNIRAENFRQLRANLQFANVDDHPRVIAVTSSIPGEGKTSIAINLAATLAEAGFSVCLVDADLRRPTVSSVLGLTGSIGLTNVLIQQVSLSEALQQAGPNLYVLASGPTPPNPSEVLASTYVRDAIRALLETIDYVVIDTAPLLPVADGSEVAALADGTLLVARHNVTTDSQVKHAMQALIRVDARILGVLLNRVPVRGGDRDYGYSYYRNSDGDGSLGTDRGRKAATGPGPTDNPPSNPPDKSSPNGKRARHRPDASVGGDLERSRT